MGVSSADVGLFTAENLDTFAAFAFLVPFNPSSVEEAPLKRALAAILNRDPSVPEMARFRRLQFESHTMVLADTKHKVERNDESAPRRLPAPERAARLSAQQTRLSTVVITGAHEPSHSLIDEVQQMSEDGLVKYIPPERCTCRSQELQGQRKDTTLGCSTTKVPVSDLSSDYMIRVAWTRRSLAFDQATIMSYSVSEAWINLLYSSMHRVAPPGYPSPNMKQVLIADAEMFILLGEERRSGIAAVVTTDGLKLPLDVAMTRLMTDARLTIFLLPIPAGGRGCSTSRCR